LCLVGLLEASLPRLFPEPLPAHPIHPPPPPPPCLESHLVFGVSQCFLRCIDTNLFFYRRTVLVPPRPTYALVPSTVGFCYSPVKLFLFFLCLFWVFFFFWGPIGFISSTPNAAVFFLFPAFVHKLFGDCSCLPIGLFETPQRILVAIPLHPFVEKTDYLSTPGSSGRNLLPAILLGYPPLRIQFWVPAVVSSPTGP